MPPRPAHPRLRYSAKPPSKQLSGEIDSWRNDRRVRVRVRYVEGRLERLDGRALPTLAHGAVCELHVPTKAFLSERDLAELSQRKDIEIFPEGTKLYVEVSERSLPALEQKLRAAIVRKHNAASLSGWFPSKAAFVEVVVGIDSDAKRRSPVEPIPLRVVIEGQRSLKLAGPIWIPSLGETATSLNHACTLISERFEPHRIAHTMNAFRNTFFEDGQFLIPLDVVRFEEEVKTESRLANEIWRQVRIARHGE